MLTPFLAHGWVSTPDRLIIAAGVTLAFAVVARALRGVTLWGALAGGVACFALFAGVGPGAFAALAALFVMTWFSTRVGYQRKQRMGLAERRDGRNAGQVLANLAVPATGALLFGATGGRVWLVAAMAALAEAATDTVASEVGQASHRDARLITTWERIPAGRDGGVSILGTTAGLASGIVTAWVAVAAGILARREMWIPITAGFAGMIADSLLGATLQRRGWISNRGVNFLSTLAAAGVAYFTFQLV